MTLAVLGLLHHAESSEFRAPAKPFDVDFMRLHAQLYERHGYDRVLIGQNARSPDPLSIAAFVSACTEKLQFMIAHRPGFIAPTMAARMFATVDRLSGGRCAAHIITAASDVETQCDGDFLTKEQRYARSREYVGILKTMWTSPTPVDHDGPFYTFKQGFCEAKPIQKPSIPIFWGGSSPFAIEVGSECADVYAIGGVPLARARSLVAAVTEAAAPHGRRPEFCLSMRIIMAPTEAEAWDKAAGILDAITEFQRAGGSIGRDKGDDSLRAVAEAAAAASGPDRHLWTGLTVATQGRTHITALVGSPEQLTEALLRYYDAGIANFILTGFDQIADTAAIGATLIPRLQAGAAERDRLMAAT